MELAIVGLGKMGMNMALRLLKYKHKVVAYNRTKEKTKLIAKKGAIPAFELSDVVKKLKKPRIIWLMLPAGKITDEHIEKFTYILEKDDLIVDGSNGFYKDDIRRYNELKTEGLNYLDAGVSGGIWGLKNGYCIMVGGEKKNYEIIKPVLEDLCMKDGYMYCGEIGAGHFVKMIHNAIEYALMQAYVEGFDLLKNSEYGKKLNLSSVAKMWNKGSVIRSWLLELLEEVLKEKNLDKIKGYVEDSGETRWAIKEAIDKSIPFDVITISLFKRFLSRDEENYQAKLLALLRNKFGGHKVLEK